jgi:hypothetical protein
MDMKAVPLEELAVIALFLDEEQEARKRKHKWIHGEYGTLFTELADTIMKLNFINILECLSINILIHRLEHDFNYFIFHIVYNQPTISMHNNNTEISSSRGDKYEDVFLLGYCVA